MAETGFWGERWVVQIRESSRDKTIGTECGGFLVRGRCWGEVLVLKITVNPSINVHVACTMDED